MAYTFINDFVAGFADLWATARIIMLGIVVIVILWWFLEQSKYNKVVRVKKQTSTHNKIYVCKAKQLKEKDGTIWWLIKGKLGTGIKVKTNPPVKDDIDITGNGKEYAEAILTQAGDIVWEKKINSGQPYGLTAEDKTILANEFYRADSWRKKSMIQWLMELGPWAFVTIMVVMAMIFWGEMMNPAIQLAQQNIKHDELQNEYAKTLERIATGVRHIEAEVTVSGPATEITPP